MFSSTTFLSILPETLMLVLAIILLAVEPFWKIGDPASGGELKRRNLGWSTAGGLLLIMIVSVAIGRPGNPVATFGNMIRFDWLGFFFKLLFMFGAAITALFLMDHEKVGHRGESYVLMLASTIGMCLMASAGDLVMLYLAIETTSIPL